MKVYKILFSIILSVILTGEVSAQEAQAKQQFVVLGRDFFKLNQEMPKSSRPGEVEVIYFFWYGSPQSFEIDKQLRAWAVSQPYSIKFTPTPASFDPMYGLFAARIFFAVEFLGKEKTINPLFLEAVVKGHVSLENPKDVLDWMDAHGISKRQFQNAINHSLVIARTGSVSSVMTSYSVRNTPTVVVDGRFVIPSRTGQSSEQWLSNTKFIIEKVYESNNKPSALKN